MNLFVSGSNWQVSVHPMTPETNNNVIAEMPKKAVNVDVYKNKLMS